MRKITVLSLFIFTMTLHGQNQLLSSIEEVYNGVTWQVTSGSNYEYDANNNLISETMLEWNFISNEWANDYKITYTYNMSTGRVTKELYQRWINVNNRFEDDSQTLYTYDDGNITELVEQTWENGDWENEYKSTFSYTGGRVIASEYSERNGTELELENRSTVNYNSNNRLESILTEDRDGSMFVLGDRQTYAYDANNKMTSVTYDKREEGNWVEEGQTVYTIDALGNRIKEESIFDGYSNETIYTYDPNLLMSNYAHPFKEKTGLDYIAEDYPYYNKLLSEGNGTNYRTVYNYDSSIVLGVEDFKIVNNNIKVFPNPTSGHITIESLKSDIKNVDIYNALGSKVFSTQENQFNIDNLRTGMYFLKITSSNGSVYTRKVIRN